MVCALTLVTNEADAAEPVNVALEFHAPQGCSDRETFVAGLRSRSNRIRIVGSNEQGLAVSVKLTPSDRGVHGELRVTDGRRESELRAVDGVDCAEVVEALSLTTALAIERTVASEPVDSSTASGGASRAAAASGGEAAAQSGDRRFSAVSECPAKSPPEGEAHAPSLREPSKLTESDDVTSSLQVMGVATQRLSSQASIGLSLALWKRTHVVGGFSPEFGLGGIYVPGDALQPNNRLRAAYVGVVIQGCPFAWSVDKALSISPCAVFELGSLTVSDRSLNVSYPAQREVVTLGGVLRAKLQLTGHVHLELDFALLEPIPARRYVAEQPSIAVGRTAEPAWQVGVGGLFGW